MINIKNFTSLKKDFFASLVIVIIAIPLSLGIAMASGTSPMSALVAAIVGGLVVGIFTGSPLLVSGPAAGLSALVFQIVQENGIEALPIIIIATGLFQLLFGFLKTGKIFNYFPMSVLEGMLAAIGLIIIFGQVHVMLGQSVPTSFLSSFTKLPKNIVNVFSENKFSILFLGLIGIGIQIYWSKLFPKLKWLPAALPAVALITIAGIFFDIPKVQLDNMDGHLQSTTSYLFSGLWITKWQSYILPGLLLAIVASAETLLTARAIDQIAAEKGHSIKSNLNKELIAQGLGNSISGILGGIPLSGVIVRSAANIQAGAQSRLSTILHGVLILLFISTLAWVIELIPLTILASVLLVTGFKLLNLKKFFITLKNSPSEGVAWSGTIIAILATNLLQGLVIGLALTYLIYTFSKIKFFKKTQTT